MLVDSHCHLNFPDLAVRMPEILANMADAGVGHAMCISVTLEKFPEVLALAEQHANLYATVGVHPDYEAGAPDPDNPADEVPTAEPDVETLVRLGRHAKVLAVGETGLDYYRLSGDLEWQRDRFRTHIRAAKQLKKPLVIHTRAAADDTLRLLREEGAEEVGGIFHCFTESWDVARQGLDMGFHLSFSGIVTFKSAVVLKEVAAKAPLDRILVETDAPYLAPVPYRGKTNEPAFVKYVAAEIAELRGLSPDAVADATTANFFRLFPSAQP
ncbi:MAG: TatD family hydrolase [Rhodocyclaceae bacterium]|nr:TatD family hydrolase [Rhodocyclaceae bacterium]